MQRLSKQNSSRIRAGLRICFVPVLCLALLFANGPHLRSFSVDVPDWLSQQGLTWADICGLDVQNLAQNLGENLDKTSGGTAGGTAGESPNDTDHTDHHAAKHCSLCKVISGAMLGAPPPHQYLFKIAQIDHVLPAKALGLSNDHFHLSSPIRAPPARRVFAT